MATFIVKQYTVHDRDALSCVTGSRPQEAESKAYATLRFEPDIHLEEF